MDAVRRSGSVAVTRTEERHMSATEVGTRECSAVRSSVQRETDTTIDFEYWLAHCEGYRVDSPRGRVGIVEGVRRAEGAEHAESLAVLAGMFGTRRLIIDVGEVDTIVPYSRCIHLKEDASIVRTEPRDPA
jgi:hypothetical protein